MKVRVLSSGSKGNTTYIETNKAKILIDIGNSCKYVKERLEEMKIAPDSIDGIIITHLHIDHIKGLKVFCKKYHVKVYLTDIMKRSLDYLDNYEIIEES